MLLLLSLAASTAACAPDFWCENEKARLSPDQREALAAYEQAAIDWRKALANGSLTAEDQQYIVALTVQADRFLEADAVLITGERAERFLAGWTRAFLTRSASRIPDAKTRLRALTSARRWAPRASSYLP